MMRPLFSLTIVSLEALLLHMPRASTAQDSSTMLLFFEERSEVLGEQFRDVLDRNPETRKELLEAISDLRVIAKAKEAEKILILSAFPHGVPPKAILVLVHLAWELGAGNRGARAATQLIPQCPYVAPAWISVAARRMAMSCVRLS